MITEADFLTLLFYALVGQLVYIGFIGIVFLIRLLKGGTK